jgi:predicted RNase H-like HicB family nuclease
MTYKQIKSDKQFQVVYEKGKSGWGASVRDLPGCIAVGQTKSEVKGLIKQAIKFHLEGINN